MNDIGCVACPVPGVLFDVCAGGDVRYHIFFAGGPKIHRLLNMRRRLMWMPFRKEWPHKKLRAMFMGEELREDVCLRFLGIHAFLNKKSDLGKHSGFLTEVRLLWYQV